MGLRLIYPDMEKRLVMRLIAVSLKHRKGSGRVHSEMLRWRQPGDLSCGILLAVGAHVVQLGQPQAAGGRHADMQAGSLALADALPVPDRQRGIALMPRLGKLHPEGAIGRRGP